MPQKSLYMQSTEVPAEKTAAQISAELVSAGARQISTDYGPEGSPVGLRFVLMVGEVSISFALPVRTEPVFNILTKRRKGYFGQSEKEKIRAQAERVAWRQLLRWVQAQLAMIEVGMVQPHEVFLPYLIHAGSGQTLFEHFAGDGLKQLAAGGGAK